MSIMTIRLPEKKHKRLKQLAHAQHVSANKLIEDFATSALTLLDRVESAAKHR